MVANHNSYKRLLCDQSTDATKSCSILKIQKSQKHQNDIPHTGSETVEKARSLPANYKITSTEKCSLLTEFFDFLSMGVLMFVGYIKEFFCPPSMEEKNRENYVPLYIGFESFYCRNVYRRIREAFEHAVCSVPGAKITLMDRYSPDNGFTLKYTGKKKELINVASYNYLGFAENHGPCQDAVKESINKLGYSTCSTRLEIGNTRIHRELEDLVAEFLGVESALTLGMGFATNSLNLPMLVGKNCLVLSDECNHASLILGLRLSGATVKVFRHNDYDHLEEKLREHLIHGHPKTRRQWKKAMIIVEGIYSMEGTICNLPRLIELKKKYKTYLYVDEAHSVGALGKNGRGVVDYFKCDPNDVDILMGTFTKSFGSVGGYVAGKKELIDYLRVSSHAQYYGVSMSPPVAQQIITSMSIIMGKDGTNEGQQRLDQLERNVHYMRYKLKQMGFIIFGHEDSPVVPLMLYMIPKIFAFVQEMAKRGVATVGVGFPATKMGEARMRFCLSASHTKQMIDEVLEQVSEVGDLVAGKHSSLPRTNTHIEW